MVSNKVAITSIVAILSITIGAYFVLGSAAAPPQYGRYLISTDGSGNYSAESATGGIDYSGTSASAVINSAISSLPAGGGTIFVDAGTYELTNTINLNKSNVLLHGAGSSTILDMQDDEYLIYIKGVDNVTIENLTLTGAGVEKSSNTLIMISYDENITVQNCYFYEAGAHTIFAVETDYSLFTRNHVFNSAWDAIALAQGSDHNIVSDNYVDNTLSFYNGIDINGRVKASMHNTIINNTILWSHGGICFDTASQNIAQGNTISHVILGIDNTGAGGTTATTDNQLIGNTISYSEGAGGYSAGIQISGLADRTTVTGNTISFFSDGRCILVGSTNNTIDNNTFNNSYLGVKLSADLNTVSNNLFQDLTTGIEIYPGGTNITLSGNTFVNVTIPTSWL